MLRVRSGDEASFGLLLEKHRHGVVSFVYRMVQNQAVAEELAQEVFLRVYRSRESYEPTAKFTTWLYRISTHVALNHIRDRRHARLEDSLDATPEDGAPRELPDQELNVEQGMLREAALAEIRQAIEELPEKQRAAVLMHKYQEMDYEQIAAALNCSESALKSMLFRAYQVLRNKLKKYAPKERSLS
ncbi:MAG: sigma-70 family RNA polymerase sigma factor [Bryobacter sp.]|nr:sigma-70 family RNA polymerase sigma factor [Bryobacter sp.]